MIDSILTAASYILPFAIGLGANAALRYIRNPLTGKIARHLPEIFDRLDRKLPDNLHEIAREAIAGIEDLHLSAEESRKLSARILAAASLKVAAEKKRRGLERMSRGWIKGTKEFRKAVLDDLKDEVSVRVSEAEAAEMREPRWERATANLLALLEVSDAQLRSDRKGAPWKVAVARLLRERYLAPNRWIAERLHMGRVSTVQGAVSRFRTNGGPSEKYWRKLRKHETLG
mgnify:CR=1 FL=1